MGSKSGFFEKHAESCKMPAGGECSCTPARFPPMSDSERITDLERRMAEMEEAFARYRQLV